MPDTSQAAQSFQIVGRALFNALGFNKFVGFRQNTECAPAARCEWRPRPCCGGLSALKEVEGKMLEASALSENNFAVKSSRCWTPCRSWAPKFDTNNVVLRQVNIYLHRRERGMCHRTRSVSIAGILQNVRRQKRSAHEAWQTRL